MVEPKNPPGAPRAVDPPDRPDPTRGPREHRTVVTCTINYRARCSCGWVSAPTPVEEIARRVGWRHDTHEQHDEDDGCMMCCKRCNTNSHYCPGCGATTEHKEGACADCLEQIRSESMSLPPTPDKEG